MILLTEELGVAILLKRLGPTEDIDLVFEYSERTAKIHMQVSFADADFDPLSQGDPTSAAMIRIASGDWTDGLKAERRIMTCRVK